MGWHWLPWVFGLLELHKINILALSFLTADTFSEKQWCNFFPCHHFPPQGNSAPYYGWWHGQVCCHQKKLQQPNCNTSRQSQPMWLLTSTYFGTLLCDMLLKNLYYKVIVHCSSGQIDGGVEIWPKLQWNAFQKHWPAMMGWITSHSANGNDHLHGVIAHCHYFSFFRTAAHEASLHDSWVGTGDSKKFLWRNQYQHVERYGMFCPGYSAAVL